MIQSASRRRARPKRGHPRQRDSFGKADTHSPELNAKGDDDPLFTYRLTRSRSLREIVDPHAILPRRNVEQRHAFSMDDHVKAAHDHVADGRRPCKPLFDEVGEACVAGQRA